MIADIKITEKSFGDKSLFSDVKFSIDDGEKIGVVGRNGIGKSTLFGILAGTDSDFTGEVIFRKGVSVVSTAQEHLGDGEKTVMSYILSGIPEYAELKNIIDTYPLEMSDDIKKIEEYSDALERFGQKGFYQIEEKVARELENFQLAGFGDRLLKTLSGGQKRMIEIVKIMHSDAHLALIDEPTNHMDYLAKQQFIDWMKADSRQAMLIITHDRDVLREVDRIVEVKDGIALSYAGNYEAYLKQNVSKTSAGMSDFEHIEKRITNLKQKVIDYQRLKEKARNPGTIQNFKRLEQESRSELAALQEIDRPSFWIDKESAGNLDYKTAGQYDKFKAKNIRLNIKDNDSRSKRVLIKATNLSLGYADKVLFEGVSFELAENQAVELFGRNGAGKSTVIHQILGSDPSIVQFDGELFLDKQIRIGIYDQEIDQKYLKYPLAEAIEKMHLDRNLLVNDTVVRKLMSDYLFTEADMRIPLLNLSGGQKARFQLISMLANDPQLLILDEPTNHLDLPSIEEMESALDRYQGAVLFVSHDNYFREKLAGEVVKID